MGLNRYLTKEDIHAWQINTWKDAPYDMASEIFKLKQWDTTLYLLEWPKYGTLTTHANKHMEQQQVSFITSENAKW